MNTDKMFEVIPKRLEDQKNAKLLEAIINRPDFVNKVNSTIEQYINKFLMPEILYGLPIDPDALWEIEDDWVNGSRQRPVYCSCMRELENHCGKEARFFEKKAIGK